MRFNYQQYVKLLYLTTGLSLTSFMKYANIYNRKVSINIVGRGKKMKNKSGFTLIELLAVVVILAVIALISTPLILNIIDGAKKGAFQSTAYGILEAGKLSYATELLKTGVVDSLSFTYEDGVETAEQGDLKLEYKGTRPKDGKIFINGKGEMAIAIHNGDYCAEKKYSDVEVTISQKVLADCQRALIATEGLVFAVDARDFTNSPTTTSWTDVSGNGKNAVPTNFGYTTSSGSNGVDGVVFDGSNDYAYTPTIAIGSSMTWEATVKLGVAQNSFVLDHRSSDVGVQPIYLSSGGNIQFFDNVKGSFTASGFEFNGLPHHIVCVGTATSRKIYYDGELIATGATGITPVTARAIYIGTRHSLSSFLNGTIKNARVYSRALSDAEVAQNYLAGQ